MRTGAPTRNDETPAIEVGLGPQTRAGRLRPALPTIRKPSYSQPVFSKNPDRKCLCENSSTEPRALASGYTTRPTGTGLCPKAITKSTFVNPSPIAAWTERACPTIPYGRLVHLSQSFRTDSYGRGYLPTPRYTPDHLRRSPRHRRIRPTSASLTDEYFRESLCRPYGIALTFEV